MASQRWCWPALAQVKKVSEFLKHVRARGVVGDVASETTDAYPAIPSMAAGELSTAMEALSVEPDQVDASFRAQQTLSRFYQLPKVDQGKAGRVGEVSAASPKPLGVEDPCDEGDPVMGVSPYRISLPMLSAICSAVSWSESCARWA